MVFVVEDLHWADPATRETISYLIRQLRTDRVVLIMTFRSDELHRRHPLLPWLAELDRSGQVERVDVERLDSTATRRAPRSHPRRVADGRPGRGDPSTIGWQPVLRGGVARRRDRMPRVGVCHRPCARSCLPGSSPCPSVPRRSSGSRRSPVERSTTTCSPMSRASPTRTSRRSPRRGRQPDPGHPVRVGWRCRRLRVPARAAPGSRLRRPAAGRTPATPPGIRRGAGRARPGQRRDGRRALG